ncbi:molybdopterin-dependent oxidoreductase [Chamaesiphon sp. OTE_75_metabat_556]|uniref:molybdopterin-dependent oxidoreductase n=1 Tax=Chamaesiphon sp. OTE_75_metabat_556 TaxID=2964692 RepID=UPI00286C7543|nr:molybdopterin-dependent oxidoreductase [Chamaesiphon sp. OTE_75_metabat_556]
MDRDEYRLTIDGEVKFPMELNLNALKQLPQTSIVMQHVCVEGWAAIVQWGGFRFGKGYWEEQGYEWFGGI